jgi:AcrR family transcriptional regulator
MDQSQFGGPAQVLQLEGLSLEVDTVNIARNVGSVNTKMDSAHINCAQWPQELFSGKGMLMNQKESGSNGERAYHHGDLRRALIEAASSLLSEDQNWNFSLREVARRAGVSHNAPYNHFADKHDLLAAIAATGFQELGSRMLASVAGVDNPKTALVRSGIVYVNFGLENPARYRLMFGSALTPSSTAGSSLLETAAGRARAILGEIIYRGAQAGVFAASPRRKEELQIAILAAWSGVHGLTMLTLDGFAANVAPNSNNVAEKVARAIGQGLFRK